MGRDVVFADDCVGTKVKTKVKALKPGDCMLLENLRFHREETIKDKAAKEDAQLRQAKDSFAKKLAALADVYVDDAFGTAHRDNASMYTVPISSVLAFKRPRSNDRTSTINREPLVITTRSVFSPAWTAAAFTWSSSMMPVIRQKHRTAGERVSTTPAPFIQRLYCGWAVM